MDPNSEARLKHIEETVEKNYQILVRMRRSQRHGQVFRVIYWTLIILLAFGSLYFIQPYLSSLLDAYTGIQNTQEQLQTTIPNLKNVTEIVNQLKGM